MIASARVLRSRHPSRRRRSTCAVHGCAPRILRGGRGRFRSLVCRISAGVTSPSPRHEDRGGMHRPPMCTKFVVKPSLASLCMRGRFGSSRFVSRKGRVVMHTRSRVCLPMVGPLEQTCSLAATLEHDNLAARYLCVRRTRTQRERNARNWGDRLAEISPPRRLCGSHPLPGPCHQRARRPAAPIGGTLPLPSCERAHARPSPPLQHTHTYTYCFAL